MVAIPAAVAETRIVPACDNPTSDRVGPITELPLPRFASIRAPEANLRRGPSLDHAIDWVIRLPNLPVCVISEVEGWRRVELPTGERGWVNAALISSTRYVVFRDAPGGVWAAPDPASEPELLLNPMIPAPLDQCDGAWCRLSFNDGPIFVLRGELWGVWPEEWAE